MLPSTSQTPVQVERIRHGLIRQPYRHRTTGTKRNQVRWCAVRRRVPEGKEPATLYYYT